MGVVRPARPQARRARGPVPLAHRLGSLGARRSEGVSAEGPVVGAVGRPTQLRRRERRRKGGGPTVEDTAPAAPDVLGLLRFLRTEFARAGEAAAEGMYATEVRPEIWEAAQERTEDAGTRLVSYLTDPETTRLELDVRRTGGGRRGRGGRGHAASTSFSRTTRMAWPARWAAISPATSSSASRRRSRSTRSKRRARSASTPRPSAPTPKRRFKQHGASPHHRRVRTRRSDPDRVRGLGAPVHEGRPQRGADHLRSPQAQGRGLPDRPRRRHVRAALPREGAAAVARADAVRRAHRRDLHDARGAGAGRRRLHGQDRERRRGHRARRRAVPLGRPGEHRAHRAAGGRGPYAHGRGRPLDRGHLSRAPAAGSRASGSSPSPTSTGWASRSSR